MKRVLVITAVLFLALVFIGCSQPQTPSTPVPPVDVPRLSSQDVISIAQEHSVTSPLNYSEKRAGFLAQTGGTKGWRADYLGNGKWIVELLERNDSENITVYHWKVVEANLAALFLGTYEGSTDGYLDWYKLKYGHYP